ncbi:16S rRNA (guanine(966)-N(2))-methyltransferase RsmD [bacterium]|nr:16S rRNA (guanine(966)-N(2))-methyltransferase RsmD [bacterium]
MRIISGLYRGQTIKTPLGEESRPTLSRVRESIFNILMPLMEEARFLDLYAGTGSIGLEALSRGAQQVVFVEADRKPAKILQDNVDKFDNRHLRTQVIVADAVSVVRQLGLKKEKYDIIFLDPPYTQTEIDRWGKNQELGLLLRPKGILLLQHAKKIAVSETWANLVQVRSRSYGKTTLSFFRSE